MYVVVVSFINLKQGLGLQFKKKNWQMGQGYKAWA
jgi:hypothetical protein